jgi:hypothetical protein
MFGDSEKFLRNFIKCFASSRRSFCLAIFWVEIRQWTGRGRRGGRTFANSSTMSPMERYSMDGISSRKRAKNLMMSMSTAISFFTCGWISFTATSCFFPSGELKTPLYTYETRRDGVREGDRVTVSPRAEQQTCAMHPEPIGVSLRVKRSLQLTPKALSKVWLAVLQG